MKMKHLCEICMIQKAPTCKAMYMVFLVLVLISAFSEAETNTVQYTASREALGLDASKPPSEGAWLNNALQFAIIDLVEFCVVNELLPPQKHGMSGAARVAYWRELMARIDEKERVMAVEAPAMREKLGGFLAVEIRFIEDNSEYIRQKAHGGKNVGYRALIAQVVRLQQRREVLLGKTGDRSEPSGVGIGAVYGHWTNELTQ